jgi:hypothetical protein
MKQDICRHPMKQEGSRSKTPGEHHLRQMVVDQVRRIPLNDAAFVAYYLTRWLSAAARFGDEAARSDEPHRRSPRTAVSALFIGPHLSAGL